jgi:RNA polymerase sigma-70 factor (ECF subfamily)
VPAPALPEEAWVHALRQGHRNARGEFFMRFHGYVERLLVRVLGPDAEIPDLVQEVFIQAFKSLVRYRGDAGGLPSWIGQITIRTARGCIRKRKVRRVVESRDGHRMDDFHSPSMSPAQVQVMHATYRLLESLPAQERIVFVLRYIDQKDIEEIATLCNVSPATVKRRTRSALERFRKRAKADPVLRDVYASGLDAILEPNT